MYMYRYSTFRLIRSFSFLLVAVYVASTSACWFYYSNSYSSRIHISLYVPARTGELRLPKVFAHEKNVRTSSSMNRVIHNHDEYWSKIVIRIPRVRQLWGKYENNATLLFLKSRRIYFVESLNDVARLKRFWTVCLEGSKNLDRAA